MPFRPVRRDDSPSPMTHHSAGQWRSVSLNALALRCVEAPFDPWLLWDGGRPSRLGGYAESVLKFSAGHCVTGTGLSADALGAGCVRSSEFPSGRRPDEGRLGDWRAVSVHPTSDLRSDMSVHLGWDTGALVVGQRSMGWTDSGQRGDANPLRGILSGGTLSRICPVQSQNLAHDPLCVLRLQFPMERRTSFHLSATAMNSETTVRNWQGAIIAEAERKLGRPLENHEKEFITSRVGFIALEMIHDTVKAAERDELEAYLSSERHREK